MGVSNTEKGAQLAMGAEETSRKEVEAKGMRGGNEEAGGEVGAEKVEEAAAESEEREGGADNMEEVGCEPRQDESLERIGDGEAADRSAAAGMCAVNLLARADALAQQSGSSAALRIQAPPRIGARLR